MKHRQQSNVLAVLIALAAIYLAIAYMVFSLRHPWATRTEAFVCTWQVVTFQAMPYEAMRPLGVR